MKKRKPAPAQYAPKVEVYNPPKFSGKFDARKPKVVVSKKLEMAKVFGPVPRSVSTEGLVIKSLPMGAGGTIPYDAEVEEIKRMLAGRVGPLYNKGGNQYIGDEDLKSVTSGSNRRRN